MKSKTWIALVVFGFAGCSGGGATNGAGVSGFESDALVQAIPYETVRNNLVQAFSLSCTSSGCALDVLDDNANTFGALVDGERNLSLSVSRMSLWARICNLGVAEGMQNIPEDLFDSGDPLNPETVCRRILGRPITDVHRAAIDKLLALDGYENQTQKQHAIGFACCAMLESQVQ
jgi:hypothetical protein